MRYSRIFGALGFAAVVIVATPTHVVAQTTTGTVVTLYADQRAEHGPVSGEAANDTVTAADASVAQAIDSTDEKITRQVEDRLSQDTRFTKVDVRTDGGAVILTGMVPSVGASARASELARGVPGVRSVKNALTYEPGPLDGIAGLRTAAALRLGTMR